MTEAVESHIGGWFWNAAARSRVRPVAQPEYDFELPASDDEDWEFTATVAVQAKPELADWTQLEVGVAEVEVPEELVQHELDALRATVAELAPVEGRPVGRRRHGVVDLVGRGRDTARLRRRARPRRRRGGDRAGPRRDERRRDEGDVVRARRRVDAVPHRDGEGDQGEGPAAARRRPRPRRERVRDVRRAARRHRVAPPRADRGRDRDAVPRRRGRRARRRLEGRGRRAARRGAHARAAARRRAPGRGPRHPARDLPRHDGPAARGARRAAAGRGAALGRARARARGGRRPARARRARRRGRGARPRAGRGASATTPTRCSSALRESGRFESLREDLRLRKALDRVAAEVKRIPLAQAEAREAIWTPDKENPPTETKLWTPDQQPPTAASEGARS